MLKFCMPKSLFPNAKSNVFYFDSKSLNLIFFAKLVTNKWYKMWDLYVFQIFYDKNLKGYSDSRGESLNVPLEKYQ